MTSQESVFEEIRGRLTGLERQNRRLKGTGAASLIVTASLILLGQASPKKTIEANEFILRDSSGNVRARLFMSEKKTANVATPGATGSSPITIFPTPTLALYDDKGKTQQLTLDGDGYIEAKQVTVFDSQGNALGVFGAISGSAGLGLANSKAETKTSLEPGRLELIDDQGFEANLGTMEIVTPGIGETRKTSAASLVLSDKDKKVIWKAP